jgi:YVTN family beta-propeller protein
VANCGFVSIIDGATNTVVAIILVGFFPAGVAFNENNGFMYVANKAAAPYP